MLLALLVRLSPLAPRVPLIPPTLRSSHSSVVPSHPTHAVARFPLRYFTRPACPAHPARLLSARPFFHSLMTLSALRPICVRAGSLDHKALARSSFCDGPLISLSLTRSNYCSSTRPLGHHTTPPLPSTALWLAAHSLARSFATRLVLFPLLVLELVGSWARCPLVCLTFYDRHALLRHPLAVSLVLSCSCANKLSCAMNASDPRVEMPWAYCPLGSRCFGPTFRSGRGALGLLSARVEVPWAYCPLGSRCLGPTVRSGRGALGLLPARVEVWLLDPSSTACARPARFRVLHAGLLPRSLASRSSTITFMFKAAGTQQGSVT